MSDEKLSILDMDAVAVSDATVNRSAPRDFPPSTIEHWVHHGTVSTKELVAELRWWADWFDDVVAANR